MESFDPGNAGTIGATVSGAIAIAIIWGAKIMAKRLGLSETSASEANQQAQKDMLDWQRDQLKDEVARREKAEGQVQTLLEKLGLMSEQLLHMERQNAELKRQMDNLTLQNEKLMAHIDELSRTVDMLRPNLNGATTA